MSDPIEGLELPLSEIAPVSGALLGPLAEPRLGARASEGVDLILEGFLLHHGSPRKVNSPDLDHRLLAGDYCSATGLVRVAETGDLGAITALSRLIALSSAMVADGMREVLPALWRITAWTLGQDDAARERLPGVIDLIISGEKAETPPEHDSLDRHLREAFA